jgi:L-lactate dehydrogenase complex protein LldG
MSSRDDILASIRVSLPRVDRPLPAVPLFDDNPPASLLPAFKDSLQRMGGVFLDPPASGDMLAPVRAKIASAKTVCSTVPEIAGNRDIRGVNTPQDLADVEFAILRASFGVAYRRPEFRDRHYASFHTGPSATADIEGVLIHGAQGVRSLSVLPLARATGNPTA